MSEIAWLVILSCVLAALIPVFARIGIAVLDRLDRYLQRRFDERERRKRDAEWEEFWASLTDKERASLERFGDALAEVANASGYRLEDVVIE